MKKLIIFLILFIPGAFLILSFKNQITYFIWDLPYIFNSFSHKFGSLLRIMLPWIIIFIVIFLIIKYRREQLRNIFRRR
jgi:cytochrome b561